MKILNALILIVFGGVAISWCNRGVLSQDHNSNPRAPLDLTPKLLHRNPITFPPIAERDRKYSADIAPREVLPFQAIRMTVGIRNISSMTIGPVRPIGAAVKAIGASGDPATPLEGQIDDNARPEWLTSINQYVPVSLDPGEQLTSSVASAAAWAGNKFGKPAFPAPGKFTMRFSFLDSDLRVHEENVTINVLTPAGDDKIVFELLKANESLASLLMSPRDVPSAEDMGALGDIIRKYPKSSYALYARFALARAYMDSLPPPGLPDEEWANAGIAHLEAIVEEKFAFQPNALIALWRINRVVAPEKAKKIEETLNRDFRDAHEWHLHAAKTVKNEDWAAFRKRKPAKE